MHTNHMGTLETIHTDRDKNLMANIASIPQKTKQIFLLPSPHLGYFQFLRSFSTSFQLPQQETCKISHTKRNLDWIVYKILHGKLLGKQQWMLARGILNEGHGVSLSGKRDLTSTCTPHGNKTK